MTEESTQSSELKPEPVNVIDPPDFQITVSYITARLGCDPPRKDFPRPNNKGFYPFMRTIESMFRYFRRQKEEITREELSELCDVSGPRINSMVKEGIVHQISQGRFDRVLSLKGIFKWMRGRIGQGETTQAKVRSRKTELENELLTIQVQRARGDALDRRDVEKAWADRMIILQQQMLTLPSQFAGRVAYFKNAAECEAELRKLMEEYLQNAARPIDYEAEKA